MSEPIEWRNERRSLGELTPWDANPRILTTTERENLTQSLKRFGYADPVVVNVDGGVVGGHQRLAILLALHGADHEVDVRVPSRPLTDAERDQLAVRLNRNMGTWDWGALTRTFERAELTDWGFTAEELDRAIAGAVDLDVDGGGDSLEDDFATGAQFSTSGCTVVIAMTTEQANDIDIKTALSEWCDRFGLTFKIQSGGRAP